MLVKIMWNVFTVSCLADLKIAAGRPSIPDALVMLICFTVFLTFSRVGGRSRSSLITFCGIKSRTVGSTVDGL